MMRTSEDLLSNELEINPVVENSLMDASKWGKFLAIAGFVTCVLMSLGGAWVSFYLTPQLPGYDNSFRIGMFIGYVIISIIFFFPCLFLFRFAVRMQTALRDSSQDNLESSCTNLKAMFRFMGILTIIMMVFY